MGPKPKNQQSQLQQPQQSKVAVTVGPDTGDVCPVCKSDRYLNPNLRLLVSLCYHKILFLAGAAPCPICKTSLRKSNFVVQTFDDLRVEKEVHYRKKVGKFFNKRLEDFNYDQRAYDDYLEEVEDIMFNLANGVDVQATNEKVERFRQENKDLIASNLSKQMNEDKALSYKLKRESEEKRIRREALLLHDLEKSRSKELSKQAMINELETSEKSAEEIILAYKKRNQEEKASLHSATTLESILRDAEYSIAAAYQDDETFADVDNLDADDFDAFDHEYSDPIPDLVLAAGYQDPWTMDIAVDRAACASGYMPLWSHTRAIQSAFYAVLEGLGDGEITQ
ncbi:TFIIH/NER complex subunit [Physocladia obscura]|uniref:RNA polymerase II transcription factor B subunit 3 n=1 Tax=Physocladia obscura TaxID=109957 RepID=A0AAD5X7K4_9FUNG|nr:TFIIH/NER complex subunit [Physocladia obscura]